MAFTQAELYADRSASGPGLAKRKAPRSQPATAQVLLPRLGHRSTGFARGVVKDMANSSPAELDTAQEQPNARKSSGLEHRSEACIVRNRCPAVGRPERGTCLVTCVCFAAWRHPAKCPISNCRFSGTPPIPQPEAAALSGPWQNSAAVAAYSRAIRSNSVTGTSSFTVWAPKASGPWVTAGMPTSAV